MGPRNVSGVCQNEEVAACGHSHWGLRCSYLWSHEACEVCAIVRVWRHADAAIGALGGAPYGTTERV
eukprot:835487-Pyramimonas_sp.AAC.1